MALSGVGSALATSLLAQTGSDWEYSRGPTNATIRFYKADLPPIIIDGGNGQLTEILMASFRGIAADFPDDLGHPTRGDRITNDTLTYEVQAVVDKCWYTIGGMIHIHAKKVAT